MKHIEKKRSNPIVGILWKLVLIVFLVGMMFSMIPAAMKAIVDYNEEHLNQAETIERCDNYYYDRDFGGLREILTLYDLYTQDYDKYWEAVNGYEDYQYYLQYKRAVAAGNTQYEQPAADYRSKVVSNWENCQFSENQKLLEEFAAQAND